MAVNLAWRQGRDESWHVGRTHLVSSCCVYLPPVSVSPCSGWSQSASAVLETTGCPSPSVGSDPGHSM